jgi:hypothetical protein
MSIEDDLEALRGIAEWFELRPHWGPGAQRDGWSVSLRSFNNLFEVQSQIIRDTPAETVAEALRIAQELSNTIPARNMSSRPHKAVPPVRLKRA